MDQQLLPTRTSVDPRFTWDAESVFADKTAWEAEYRAVVAAIPGVASRAGTLGHNAPGLGAFFHDYEALGQRMFKLYFYGAMAQAVDTNDQTAQTLQGQAGALYGKFLGAMAFIDPELLALGRPTLEAWVASEPSLKNYAHFVDNLFRSRDHIRSPEVEEVLGTVSEVFEGAEAIHDYLVDADLKFSPAAGGREVAQSTIEALMADRDREVRRTAWESYTDGHLALKNTLAASLTTAVKKDVFVARTRRFDSSLEGALFETNIPRKVFDQTLGTFQKNLPIWHRYWRAKRKALKVDRLHHYDIWAPVSSKPPVVPYRQAVDWIVEALAPLGRPYVDTLRAGCLDQRWVDVYPTVGKGSGAFSYGTPQTHPFIMMSYTDDLSSVSTLTHELGHSMHSWHTWNHQPPVYADYSIFAAEVASNFNQALTRAHLFSTQKDPQFQLALVDEAMENFHRYFFIMPTLARFELEHHRRIEAGDGVTADDLNSLMADLFAEGYGGEVEIDRDREGSTWAQFGHLYMNYYVFQYATGISAAHALADPILKGDQGATARYLDFLSAGSSVYPVEALRRAGVDMTTPAAMEKGFEVVSGLVDRLEALTS